MKVESLIRPEYVQCLQGVQLVSFNIEECTKVEDSTESTYYEYEQIKVDATLSLDAVDKAVTKAKIAIYKSFLDKTDHKFYTGYKPKDDEDLVTIELQRDVAREFVRNS